jgi:hypothetical protein
VTGVGAGRAAAGWRFRAPLGVPAQKKGEGGGRVLQPR